LQWCLSVSHYAPASFGQHFSASASNEFESRGCEKGVGILTHEPKSCSFFRSFSRGKKSLIEEKKEGKTDASGGELFFKFCGVAGVFFLFSRVGHTHFPTIYIKNILLEGRPIPWFTEVSSWLVSPPYTYETQEEKSSGKK
jgi:hypothetical protein